MDLFDELFCGSCGYHSDLAECLFETLGEDGIWMAVLDGRGNSFSSRAERFMELFGTGEKLQQICERLADGVDPLMTNVGDVTVVGTCLHAPAGSCAYMIMVLDSYSPESALINAGLVELTVNQAHTISHLLAQRWNEQDDVANESESVSFDTKVANGICG